MVKWRTQETQSKKGQRAKSFRVALDDATIKSMISTLSFFDWNAKRVWMDF